MRRTQQVILAGSMALAMGIGLAGVQIAIAAAPPISASAAFAVTDDSLSTDLAYSRDEERMARDLYLLFGQTYGAAVFDRIAASEQRHFDAGGFPADRLRDHRSGCGPAGRYLHQPGCAAAVRPVEGGGPDLTRGRVCGGRRTGADRYRRPGEDHRPADATPTYNACSATCWPPPGITLRPSPTWPTAGRPQRPAMAARPVPGRACGTAAAWVTVPAWVAWAAPMADHASPVSQCSV